jgi:Berberine and berberine like/Phage integrase family
MAGPNEAERLLDTAVSLRDRVMLSLGCGCGLRAGEIVRLRDGDLDCAQMIVRIVQSKGRKDRHVVLPRSCCREERVTFELDGDRNRDLAECDAIRVWPAAQPKAASVPAMLRNSTVTDDTGQYLADPRELPSSEPSLKPRTTSALGTYRRAGARSCPLRLGNGHRAATRMTSASSEDGTNAIQPIRAALPAPIVDWVGPMPFPALQSMFDPLMPAGLQWYWKGAYVRELPDAAIDVHLEYAAALPSEVSAMHLYPMDGAVHRVGKDATAWSCRDATWNMVIAGIDPDPAKAGSLKQWGRAYWEALRPFTTGGGYVNFMMGDEGGAQIKATFGGNFERLRAVKRKFDPNNVFRVNQNIKP